MRFVVFSLFVILGLQGGVYAQTPPAAMPTTAKTAVMALDKSHIPTVVSGASPVFDNALLILITSLKAFHDSNAFTFVMYSVFILCAVIGITWKALSLMYGEGELGQVLLWGFMRFCLGFGLFFMSLHLTFLVVGLQNVLSEQFVLAGKAIRPADSEFANVLVGLEVVVREFDESAFKVTSDIKIAFEKDANKALGYYVEWLESQGYDEDEVIMRTGLQGAYDYGFPLLNYGLKLYPNALDQSDYVNTAVLKPTSKTVVYNVGNLIPFYVGSSKPLPFIGFNDYHNIYNLSDRYIVDPRIYAGAKSDFVYRPLNLALSELRAHVLARASSFTVTSSKEDISKFVQSEMPVYKVILGNIFHTFLADYANFKLWRRNPLVSANLSGKDVGGRILTERKVDAPSDDSAGAEFTAILLSLEKRLAAYEKEHSKAFDTSYFLGLVISFSLAVVSFYTAISVWSLPILLKIWASFYWLPEQFEFSGALKKGAKYVLVLIALPVFSILIVQIALAVSDSVDKLALGKSVADLSFGDMVWNHVTGKNFLYLVLRFGVWIFAALFIMGTPKILNSMLSGAGGLAEGIISKVGMAAAGGAFVAKTVVSVGAAAATGGVSAGVTAAKAVADSAASSSS